MEFYRTSFMIMLVILIIVLTVMGVALHNSTDVATFPPHISECPDFYVKQEGGICLDEKSLARTGSDENNVSCTRPDFSGENFTTPGMGPQSGICAKKRWAESCGGVPWDGITNNEDVCYKVN